MSKILYIALQFFASLQRFSFKNLKFRSSYHPSIIASRKGRRSSSIDRMEAVASHIGAPGVSVLDVGCAEGLFSLGLAERGCTVLGLEGKLSRVIQAYADAAKANLFNISFMNINLDAKFVSSLPTFDYILLLAVWHHMVKRNSLDIATENLKLLWEKCDVGLVFETGLMELSSEYKLKGWTEKDLINYLEETLKPGSIKEIGRFQSFDSSAFTSSEEKFEGEFERPIFLIEK